MERIFEVKESEKLGLWYIEATLYSKNYGEVTRRFRPYNIIWGVISYDITRLFDSSSDEGEFSIKQFADARLHFPNDYTDNQLTLREVVCNETHLGWEVIEQAKFDKYFNNKQGRGRIDCIAFAPIDYRYRSLWFVDLYTCFVREVARRFSFHDFIHILGKSFTIQEEQTRRYEIPTRNITVEVAVADSGKAKLVQLLHNGKPIEIEYEKFDIKS